MSNLRRWKRTITPQDLTRSMVWFGRDLQDVIDERAAAIGQPTCTLKDMLKALRFGKWAVRESDRLEKKDLTQGR